MSNVIELNERNFDEKIKKGKWIIDFWAPWCGPCKIMGPHFDEASNEYKGKVNFGKVNIDENYNLADNYQVMSIPTTIFFNEGEVVHVTVGALGKKDIIDNIDNVFK
jgi:thioredoxin 1